MLTPSFGVARTWVSAHIAPCCAHLGKCMVMTWMWAELRYIYGCICFEAGEPV
jgi:hypothetical protein